MFHLWNLLPQPFPAPIFIHEGEITRSKTCKTYCSVCCSGYFIAWVLVISLAGILCAWIWLLIQINYTMPQTFAWETLLRTFGSGIYVKECSNETGLPIVTGDLSECWTKGYTLPVVPIIAVGILSMTVINGIWCLLPVSLLNLYNAVLSMRANLAWHVFFFLISIVVVSIYFALDLTGLKSNMEISIGLEKGQGGIDTISPRWRITQLNGHCCGINNFTDWKLPTGKYPASCCKTPTVGCTFENAWAEGCFNNEYNKVVIYGGTEILLIWTTYFVSLCLYKVIVALSLKQYQEARAEGDVTSSHAQKQSSGKESVGPETPLLLESK